MNIHYLRTSLDLRANRNILMNNIICFSSSGKLCDRSQPILANVKGIVVLQVAVIIVIYELQYIDKTKRVVTIKREKKL